jgi:ribosomal protein L21E
LCEGNARSGEEASLVCLRTYHIGDYVDIRVNEVVPKDVLAVILDVLDEHTI